MGLRERLHSLRDRMKYLSLEEQWAELERIEELGRSCLGRQLKLHNIIYVKAPENSHDHFTSGGMYIGIPVPGSESSFIAITNKKHDAFCLYENCAYLGHQDWIVKF